MLLKVGYLLFLATTMAFPGFSLIGRRSSPALRRLYSSTLPGLAEWRAWLPISKRSSARSSPNHYGVLAEWRQWVLPKRRGLSSESGEEEDEDEEAWKKFNFGTFASHLGPTKEQDAQLERLTRMARETRDIDPLWQHLDDGDVRRGIEAVSRYVTEERRRKFQKVLSARTNFARFVFENPVNVNNVWACLRTFDSFGMQYTNVISEAQSYHTSWRRQTMTQALGAQKWMSLRQEDDTAECIKRLKAAGYRIAASDLHARSVSAYEVDWTSQKTAIVLGNENSGITDAVRAEADVLFYLPMKGFAESLNVSAFVASLCAVLEQKGCLDPSLSTISDDDRNRIMLTWLARSAPSSLDIMKRAGIDAGDKVWDTVGAYTTRP